MTLPLRYRFLMMAIAATSLAPGCGGSLMPASNDAGGTGLGGATIVTGAGAAGGIGGPSPAIDASCAMTCGLRMDGVTTGDGTCQYILRCPVSGDFTRLAIVVNGQEAPMDSTRAEGWDYTDDSMLVFQLYGQACADALDGDGGQGSVAIVILCDLP